MFVKDKDALVEALFNFLLDFEKPLDVKEIYAIFPKYYTFRANWYRQVPQGKYHNVMREMGYEKPGDVPESEIPSNICTENHWKKELRDARDTLKKKLYLANTPRGTWMLKPEIRQRELRRREERRIGTDSLRKQLHELIDEQNISFVEKVWLYAKDLLCQNH